LVQQRIVLTPESGELRVELVGYGAGILTIAVKAKAPGRQSRGFAS
jgi:hypothetical protein